MTLVARSTATPVPIAQELGGAGAEVVSVQADAGEPYGLRAALVPIFAAARRPGDRDLRRRVHRVRRPAHGQPGPARRRVRGQFTGGEVADALPAALATVSLGKVTLRALATMLARGLRADGVHAAGLTILGQIAPGTPFDPDRIADVY